GGGARAAYQVGAMSALLDILDPDRRPDFELPFSIISGTSAGAINAASLASHAHQVHRGLYRLTKLWSGLETNRVYRADAPGLTLTGLRWLAMLSLGWLIPALRGSQPRSLLDNSPLRALLKQTVNFD